MTRASNDNPSRVIDHRTRRRLTSRSSEGPRSRLRHLRALPFVALAGLAVLASAGAPPAVTASPRLERRVLEALTANQAEAFARGADPTSIVLAGGETLAELLARVVKETAVELSYTPVDPCVLVRTVSSAAGPLAAGETRAFRARGSLSAQGGTRTGCGVPDDAQALAAIVRVAASRGKGSLRVWPAGDPEPGISLLDYTAAGGPVMPLLLELCHGNSCAADFQVHALGAGTNLRIDVVGYFAPEEVSPCPAGSRTPGATRLTGPARPARARRHRWELVHRHELRRQRHALLH
jgi:hypothetical protein